MNAQQNKLPALIITKFSVLIKSELQYSVLPVILISLFVSGICYVIFGVENLELFVRHYGIERFLPFIGVFALTSIFQKEQTPPIKDMLRMKNDALFLIYSLRFALRMIIFAVTVFLYILIIFQPTDLYSYSEACLHSMTIGTFVGAIGLMIFSISNNIAPAYLISTIYLLIQWFIPRKTLGVFYLYDLKFFDLGKTLIMLAIGLLLMLISFLIWQKKRTD